MSTCSRFRGRRRIPPGAPALEELPRRYRALYTGAVSDVLDSLGLRQQALPHSIMPLAVVDGGVRDSGVILRMGFPVFCRFRRPARSIGRWAIQEWMVPIRIGDATISPDDFVCGDIMGWRSSRKNSRSRCSSRPSTLSSESAGRERNRPGGHAFRGSAGSTEGFEAGELIPNLGQPPGQRSVNREGQARIVHARDRDVEFRARGANCSGGRGLPCTGAEVREEVRVRP